MSPATNVLLAEAVRLLAIVGEAGLHRVRALGERQIVLDREPRLLELVIRHAARGRTSVNWMAPMFWLQSTEF